VTSKSSNINYAQRGKTKNSKTRPENFSCTQQDRVKAPRINVSSLPYEGSGKRKRAQASLVMISNAMMKIKEFACLAPTFQFFNRNGLQVNVDSQRDNQNLQISSSFMMLAD
jgi:hypothetical protein